MDGEIKISKEVLVYENSHGLLFDDEVVFLPQGVNGKYVRWKWKYPYSVAVLPILTTGEVILVEGFKHSARKAEIEVPKGFGEEGLAPEDVAVKELKEELGLVPGNIKLWGKVFLDSGFNYHPYFLFIAYECQESESQPEQTEVLLRNIRFTIKEKDEVIKKLEICDVLTILLLNYFEKNI